MTNAENAIANLKNMKYLCETDNHGRGYGIFHVNEGDKAWIDEAIKALSEPTIPLSVIEDIKAEIEKAYKHQRIVKGTEWTNGVLCAVEIIDKAVKEYTHEDT